MTTKKKIAIIADSIASVLVVTATVYVFMVVE